jgi:hypothetical protein
MLRNINEITIREFIIFDNDKNPDIFKRWFNIFPVRWFDFETVISSITAELNNGVDRGLLKDAAKLLQTNKILMLQGCSYALYNLLILKTSNTMTGALKPSNNLIFYIDKVLELSGITIKLSADLERLNKYIERLNDKFIERYSVKPNTGKKDIPFLTFAYSAFRVVGDPYNPNMTLYEFVGLAKTASNIAKQTQENKIKNGRS